MAQKKNFIGNFLFIIILIALIRAIVYFLQKEDAKIVWFKNNHDKKIFLSSLDISIKNRLNSNASQIKIFKNSIEKILESRTLSVKLTVRDCRDIKKTSLTIGNLLEEMSRQQYSPEFLAEINAADEIRKLVFLETAKLEAFLKDTKINKSKIRDQLLKLEENLYKMELHLNALLSKIQKRGFIKH